MKANHSTIVGKLYMKNCIYCVKMAKAWDQMKESVKNIVGGVKEFEVSEESKLAQFNAEHGTDIAPQEGFPTLYRLHDGKVTYYTGGRSKEELIQWALNGSDAVNASIQGGKKGYRKTYKSKKGARRTRKTRKNRTRYSRKGSA